MAGYTFNQLVDIAHVRQLLESHHRQSGMSYGVLDSEEQILIAVGRQDICVQFHRDTSICQSLCRESNVHMKKRLLDFNGDYLECRCKNGLVDVAMPVMIDGEQLATLFTSRFFYDDDRPAAEFFRSQAEEFGFDTTEYLKALENPVFTREYVRGTILFLRDLVKVLAEIGLKNLTHVSEVEECTWAEEALRQSEERFRQLFEQNDDSIILFKPATGEIIDVNPATEKLYGYTKNDLILHGASLFIESEDIGEFRETFFTVKEKGHSEVKQINGIKNDGTKIVLAIRGQQILLQNEEVFYCTFRDITRKLGLEQEARETQSKLIQACKMSSLGMLVSGIAHEINNPNSFIKGNAGILDKIWSEVMPILADHQTHTGNLVLAGFPVSELESAVPRLLNGLKEGSRRIGAIVDNLKDYTREDATGICVAIDLNTVIRSAVLILGFQIHCHTDDFRLELAADLPPALGNAQQVEQVVINLVINALQALTKKSSAVTVSTQVDPASDMIVVTVRDEGKGMTKEVMERLTEPSFSTRLDQGGSGLGLSISETIIRGHNGELRFDSTPEGGSLAMFTLPRAPGNGQPSHVMPTKEHP